MTLQTTSGKLTAYGFACGYIETRGSFRLWREHGVYHVTGRAHDGARIWESARTLTDARRTLRQCFNVYGTANRHTEAVRAQQAAADAAERRGTR